MRIRINAHYRPYAHEVGSSCLLPNSSWKVTVFPTRVEFANLVSEGSQKSFFVRCAVVGPLSQFTVMQDLERKWVRVFGRGGHGFFSYRLLSFAHDIVLFLERAPEGGMAFTHKEVTHVLKGKEEFIMSSGSPSFSNVCAERMHFGCHKRQDWTLVKRRLSLREILPIWFELGKNVPKISMLNAGTARLLTRCSMTISQKDREEVGKCFLDLFRVGFEGILVPRLEDTDYQGVIPDRAGAPKESSPLMLLGEGARLIRQLLVQEREEQLSILPCLPPEIHAGRFVGVECEGLILDLEWSKKSIRRLILYPKRERVCHLKFQPAIRSYRLRRGLRDRGATYRVDQPLDVVENSFYILDRFQK